MRFFFLNFHHVFFFLCHFHHLVDSHLDVTRYSSEEMSGNESKPMTEVDRQAEMNRHKEEMKRKRRRKKRTSSSLQSSCFQGKLKDFNFLEYYYCFNKFLEKNYSNLKKK